MASKKKSKKHPLVGAIFESVALMPKAEVTQRGWFNAPAVFQLWLPDKQRTKLRLFPSSDPEGNDGGTIFGEDRSGDFTLQAPEQPDTGMRGLVVTAVTPMTKEKLKDMYWEPLPGVAPSVIHMSDGGRLFVSQDPEGNGPGVWVLESPQGEELF